MSDRAARVWSVSTTPTPIQKFMSLPQNPDGYRNNKRQRSLNTSVQISGIPQSSGAIVNKRPRSRSPVTDAEGATHSSSRGLDARIFELIQQIDELGIPIFSHSLSVVLDIVSSTKNKDLENLINKICDLCDLVVERLLKPLQKGQATSTIGNTVKALTSDLQRTVTEYHRQSAETRCYPGFEDNITTTFLESVMHVLQRSLELPRPNGAEEGERMSEAIESIGRDTGDTLEIVQHINAQNIAIQQTMTSIHYESTLNRAEEAALSSIPRVDSARYDSAPQLSSSFCLEDTRVALLQEIEQWAEDPGSRPIFWLCGMAGTGKSTIARTVAKLFDERHWLGASFFFSRDEDDRRTASLVFPTIAQQLARSIPSLREYIIKAAIPEVCTSMMRTQLNKLIVEPFQRSTFQSSTLVIVMDALDECAKETQITEMLALLAPAIQVIQKTRNIKLFLTSRPEVHISAEFREPGMQSVSNVSILHDIEKSLVRTDISRYVEHHLQRIGKLILPRNVVWPTVEEKEALINMSDGLFIFAAATVAFIGDTKYRQPKQRLRNLLSDSNQGHASASLMHLDFLYRQILMASLPDNDNGQDLDGLKLRIREILGTVILLMYPLSSQSLEKLLEWEEDSVEPTLGPFHSVLPMTLDQTPIRVFHKSFPDFLMDKRRSGGFWFHIDPMEHHGRLALLCLTHMNTSLRRDMCGVGNQLVSELGDVESVLMTNVGAHILYACRYWEAHLKEAEWTDELGAALKEFCECKILYWLEILCLDRKLSSAILAVDSARKWVLDEASSATLANCYRYLLYFHTTIALGPSLIYHSTLPFVPRLNLSSSPWEKELYSSPRVVMTSDSDIWDRILFTLRGHDGQVQTVAYSPNGGLLASGSDDNRVIIWDSRTGAEIHSLEGHSAMVLAIAFSPDGNLIASGSHDKSVRIWSSLTGILIHTLVGHSGAVTAVSFSPVRSIVASGSSDKTVTLWDSGTGSRIRILRVLSGWSWTISFSPDGTQIVSKSSDSSIIIWDTDSGAGVSELKANESSDTRTMIYFIAFSPDGTRLASAYDKEVIIWDYKSRTIFRRLEGEALCLAFSPDGRFIVTGRGNGQIVTWDIIKGSPIGIFGNHTKAVVSIAVSPDGSRILTGSYDRTAAVWDMRSGWESPGVDNDSDKKIHRQAVCFLAFSSDGNRMVSAANDNTLAVWDVGGRALMSTLKGHGRIIRAVAFSADGRYLAFAPSDKLIIVWDAEIGECVKTLDHDGIIARLTFSLDGLYLLVGCSYWDFAVFQATWVWQKWRTDNSQEDQLSSLEVEEAKQMLRNIPESGVPPSRMYVAKDEDAKSLEKRHQTTTIRRLYHLPQHDITVSASFGRYFVFGTRLGTIYFLDLPPEAFNLTSTAMYLDIGPGMSPYHRENDV
ncbi:hypothetical protein FRC02_010366 [Tulasnella sp. 418]|nr:hypothetical protein FRC02_010366 [Tulasnella sp. 418]